MRSYLKFGDWNAVCDVCGFEFKASELKERWDGARVCDKDWETRHISDLYRYTSHEKAPPWTRPEPEDNFIDTSTPIITEDSQPILAEYPEVPLFTET